MANPLEKGLLGEDIAAQYLQRKGYQILVRNFRSGKAEIDLLCRIGDELVVVEVKTRKNSHFGFPEEWVSEQKIKMLTQAAEDWIEQNNFTGSVRYDIVAITQNDPPELEHFEDAFWPQW